MILILTPNIHDQSPEYKQLMAHLAGLQGIQARVHVERGTEQSLTEIYLIGNTKQLGMEDMQNLPGVERVVRVSEEYRILGRHKDDQRPTHFEYNGVRFGQDTLNVFAGLCAVDNREHVEIMMKAVHEAGQVCTRMGAYKSRTSPYAFQGHGKNCLPYVFELAGKYGIKVDRKSVV
jgi:3-deoxy-7-phosphoheptulonate synthase